MKYLILHLTFVILFVALSIVVTASGLGVIDLWLEANTDLSPFQVTVVNWGLWGAYFASFAAGLKISGGHIEWLTKSKQSLLAGFLTGLAVRSVMTIEGHTFYMVTGKSNP